LHSMAMELGLGYGHDVRNREVSVCRPGRAQSPSKPQPASGSLSSLPRSSTELDSVLCLPGLPMVPEQGHDARVAHEPSRLAAHLGPQALPDSVTDDQALARRPSRSERLFSTIRTSISKGGRRGPLSENGRRDMRALESAGGACWRCKVLRRKVSSIHLPLSRRRLSAYELPSSVTSAHRVALACSVCLRHTLAMMLLLGLQ
jgi:hypothetical protein